jgi:thioredoxin reductase
MKHYSKEYFPPADTIVKYFEDFASNFNLNIQYNTEIKSILKQNSQFNLMDQNGDTHTCQVLIISTGLWVPVIPDIKGIETAEGYESVSIDPDDFIDKTVLIIGRGNAGFETAANIVGTTSFIHMASRSRIKMAYQTHYVGDLRAINDDLIDTYQLKSLDGQTEISDTDESKFITKDGKKYIVPINFDGNFTNKEVSPGYFFPYDSIIRCTGFKFDFSPFDDSTKPDQIFKKKFPKMRPNYESTNIPDMFFAGVISHSVDYKKSAGGFIHGFRYTARALYHHLEWKYHGSPWPSVSVPVTDLLHVLVKRINEASGLYQMFSILGDVVIFRDDKTAVFLEEVPIYALGDIKGLTGHEPGKTLIFNFEYGKFYSGPGEDVLRSDRVTGNPVEADQSNFLHPVLYYYQNLPSKNAFKSVGVMPPPTSYHHVVEDFLTDWTSRQGDVIPIRRFIESIVGEDLRAFSSEECFELTLLYGINNVPLYCHQHYLQGVSVSAQSNRLSGIEAEKKKHLKEVVPELYQML